MKAQAPAVREPRPSPHPADANKPTAIPPTNETESSRPNVEPRPPKRRAPSAEAPTQSTGNVSPSPPPLKKPSADAPVPKRKFDPDAAGGTVEK